MSNERFRVCFIHDWLVAMRGGEKVLEALTEIFPEAPIYTLFLDRGKLSPALKEKTIHTSFLQYIPGISTIYRWLLPLFPLAIRSLRLPPCNMVISSSHCVAKSVVLARSARHICYCHTPMRYLWGMTEEYLQNFPFLIRRGVELYFKWLRRWDRKTAQGVHQFIANSNHIAEKIRAAYGRTARVIYPPATVPDVSDIVTVGNFFLIVSALVPYKRINLAVEAFNELKLPLKIVGEGPLRASLKKMIRFDGIEILGKLNVEQLKYYYQNSWALIFPGEEDFGIAPVEAQMYGKPVIAYGKGGACETVLAVNRAVEENINLLSAKECTGLLFHEQTPDALSNAVRQFQMLEFDPVFIRKHAEQFSRERFKSEIKEYLTGHLQESQIYEST